MRTSLLIIFLSSSILFAQDLSLRENRLIVYGEGSVAAPPNRAQLTFTVVGLGSSMQSAMQSARAKLDDISTKLFSVGLTPKNLSTSNFYSGDNPQGKAFLSSSKDYRTQMDVLVTIDSLNLVDPAISLLAEIQVERLSNISFALKSDSAMRLEARRLAAANAQVKAQLMANQLGIQLGKVVYVEEVSGMPGGFSNSTVNYSNTNTISIAQQQAFTFSGGQRFTITSYVKLIMEIK